MDLFSFAQLNSTNDESMILNEKSESGKGQIGVCIDIDEEQKWKKIQKFGISAVKKS